MGFSCIHLHFFEVWLYANFITYGKNKQKNESEFVRVGNHISTRPRLRLRVLSSIPTMHGVRSTASQHRRLLVAICHRAVRVLGKNVVNCFTTAQTSNAVIAILDYSRPCSTAHTRTNLAARNGS